MTAAEPRPSPPVSLAPASVYPGDCIIWSPTVLDSRVEFDTSALNEEQGARQNWRRNIVLRPAKGNEWTRRVSRGADHDQVRTYLLFDGKVFRFTMTTINQSPKRRFHDHGPVAVLSLYPHDMVKKVDENFLTRDIPHIDGTFIVVTWSQFRQSERLRHVALLPNFWPSA